MKNCRPILTCKEAAVIEADILTDDAKNYIAITQVGRRTAERFLNEFGSSLPESPKILVVAGKGHNGADAIIAAREICAKFPKARLTVVTPREMEMKKLTYRAFAELKISQPSLRALELNALSQISDNPKENFDLLIEGLIGLSFTPPARDSLRQDIERANKISAAIKISMDIPAGASDDREQPTIFKADATYANAIAKTVIFKEFNKKYVGRIRYVDIGFSDLDFPSISNAEQSAKQFIVSPRILEYLKKLRNAQSDKRSYGHLYIFAGSESFPGAALLNTTAALRAGVGLVTVFVPKSLVASFAAVQPSAIWVGCDVDRNGAMISENISLLENKKKPTAILAGSGLTNAAGTRNFVAEVLKKYPDVPRVLDADAVCGELAQIEHSAPLLMTPHAGEFLRLAPNAENESLLQTCKKYGATIALKGAVTRISAGDEIVCCTEGGPILSRGGSGDILAGICGALVARTDLEQNATEKLASAAIWLGSAAESAFSQFGENAVATSDIVKLLDDALKKV